MEKVISWSKYGLNVATKERKGAIRNKSGAFLIVTYLYSTPKVRQKYAAAGAILKLPRITMARIMAEASGGLDGPGPSAKSLIVPYCLFIVTQNDLLYERMSIDWHDPWLLPAPSCLYMKRHVPNPGIIRSQDS